MKIENILLYEPQRVENLYPLSIMHCAWEIRCGALRIFEKIQLQFPDARIIYNGRTEHLNSFFSRFNVCSQDIQKGNTLLLNSAILPTSEFWNEIEEKYNEFLKNTNTSNTVVFAYNGIPVAAYIPSEEYINPSPIDKAFLPNFVNNYFSIIPTINLLNVKVINYLWNAIQLNSFAIRDDLRFFESNNQQINSNNYYLVNEENIRILDGVTIKPNVVIDASDGPVIIDKNVKILPNSTIIGPCYIGQNSLIKVGAKIYQDTSIGEWCKVGGEVENSIIHSYANKQHEGFLGHSYISEWVNIGADTNTSDLKNTYSEISINLDGKEIKTGTMFLGLLCGDHTKTAINTTFNTGTVAGICGILVHDGFLPNSISSFAWRGSKNCSIFKVEKAIEIAKIAMARRKKTLTDEEKVLFEMEFKRVKGEY